MMGEKVFAEGVAEDIKEYLPPDYADVECKVAEKRKNNGAVKAGLAFQKPGKLIPVFIFVEPFYQEICQGKPLDGVMEKIAGTAWEVMERNHFSNLSDIDSFEKIKDYLEVKIINTRANRKELRGLVHQEKEDLSLIPVLKCPFPEQRACGNVKISNELMEFWEVSADTVMDQAWENTRQNQPPTLRGLGQMLCYETEGQPPEGDLLDERNPMKERPGESAYILSNKSGVFGAVYLASPEVMEKISGLFPEGFYLLPSSVHEILVMPKDGNGPGQEKTPFELGEMVREVNRTCVEREEILSDRIYEYNRENGKIRQVPESIKKERGMER